MDKLFRPVSTSGINTLGPVVENSNKCVFVLISMLGRVINNVVLVLVLSRFNTVFPKERGSNVRESRPFSQDDLSNPQICSTRVGLEVWTTARSYGIKVTKRISLNSRIRTQAFTWNKHGFLLLAAPERSLLIDITISMDVELNPGPSASADATVLSTCESRTTEHYHRNQLHFEGSRHHKVQKQAWRKISAKDWIHWE